MSIKKIYVKVTSDFDETGFMSPRTIIWDDGRAFNIERIKDYRPADSIDSRLSGDCYTVVIRGTEKHLFFERTDPLFRSRVGRWFVEQAE